MNFKCVLNSVRQLTVTGLLFCLCSAGYAQNSVQIQYGDIISSEISVLGETDTFAFNGMAGDIAIIRMKSSSGTFDGHLQLYAPSGALIADKSQSNDLVRIDTERLTETGLYTIQVSERDGNQTGVYDLALQKTAQVPDARPIGYNETITASVDYLAEMDAFTFSGAINDIVIIQMKSSSGTFDGQLELYTPSGQIVTIRSETNAMVRLHTQPLTEDGLYTILAMEADGDQTGSYGLSLQRTSNPPNAPVIGYNETLTASIDNLAEMDAFTFNGSENDIVMIQLKSSSGTFDGFLELYAPSGQLIASKAVSNELVRIDTEPLSADGLYTILVMEGDGDQTGLYGLSLQRTFEPPNAIMIRYNETYTASIIKLAETDAFTFNGSVNDVVILQMKSSTGSFDGQLELYSPSGELITAKSETNGLVRIEAETLTETGLFTVFAMERDGDQTGSYGLSLQRTFDPPNAQHIGYNEMATASIYNLAEMDAFTFQGASGDKLITQMISSSRTFDGQLELYGPSGEIVAAKSESNGLVRIGPETLTENGLYTLLVMERDGDQTGSYSLTLQRTFDPPNAHRLAYDESITASIDNLAEIDVYTFFGYPNDSIFVEMNEITATIEPRVELYDKTGNLMYKASSSSAAATIPAVLPDSGLYTLFVMDGGGDENGNYTITVLSKIPVNISEAESELPVNFYLYQNYPNPFNPRTTVAFEVPQRSDIQLEVYDILGHNIKTLLNETVLPGKYKTVWDGTNNSGQKVASGTYLLHMRYNNSISVKRMILVR